MDIAPPTGCCDCNRQYELTLYEPPGEHVTLTMLTERPDAALHIWDQDHASAKSLDQGGRHMLRGAVANVQEEAFGVLSCGLAPWQARKVTEFIKLSLGWKIRVRGCAKRTRLSVSHFSVAFKVTFGTTVGGYIRHRRVERAQRMMLLSTMPPSQVAVAVGFSDQAHFCQVFPGVMGIRPDAWRHKNLVLTPTYRAIVGGIWQMKGLPCG